MPTMVEEWIFLLKQNDKAYTNYFSTEFLTKSHLNFVINTVELFLPIVSSHSFNYPNDLERVIGRYFHVSDLFTSVVHVCVYLKKDPSMF